MEKIKYLSFVIALVLFSCNDEDDNNPPKGVDDDIITIYSPIENQEFKNGDSLNIHAKISSKTNLHGYEILIEDENEDTLYFKDEHWHGHELDIQEKWAIDAPAPQTLEVEIKVIKNHDGDTESEDVDIRIVQ